MHAHLAIRHLIRKLELQGRRRPAVSVPAWLMAFLEGAAELFDPAVDFARAGYECRITESGWQASLFLGRIEQVGGAEDGRLNAVAFDYDVRALCDRFDQVDSVNLSAASSPGEPTAETDVRVSVRGVVGGHPLRIDVLNAAPACLSPGMRRGLDGRCELAD
ncbi:MAG: hypothetical protein KF774_07165 [Planctomyces sp.]|nr:hypothetical protein [Planctomyces sp.]